MALWNRIVRTLRDGPVADPGGSVPDGAVQALVDQLDAAAQRRLGRSLVLRHMNSGSCNGCELELRMLDGVVYDLERFGLRFTASPRHADVLLVTGPLTRNLHEALLRTWAAMPEPKWAVAVGDCAADGGLFRGSYAVHGGVSAVLPVALAVRGCPPTPAQVLLGLRVLIEANV